MFGHKCDHLGHGSPLLRCCISTDFETEIGLPEEKNFMMEPSKELVIYYSRPYTKYRWVSYYSSIYFAFISIGLFLKPMGPKRESKKRQMRDEFSDPGPIEMPQPAIVTIENTISSFKQDLSLKNLYLNFKYDPLISSITLFAAISLPAIFVFYVRRMVHEIALLPQGRVRFSIFSPFPLTKPTTFDIPVKDISCVTHRTSDSNYSVLKLRGFIAYHLVHKGEGTITQPQLYDKYLGYQRTWPPTGFLKKFGF